MNFSNFISCKLIDACLLEQSMDIHSSAQILSINALKAVCFLLFMTVLQNYIVLSVNDHPIHVCEMFFSTSLLAVVCNSTVDHFTPKILYLYNTKIDQVICLLRFNEEIQGVKLNQQ